MFRFKWIAVKGERSYGVAVRVFGIDISFLVLGFLDDWRVVDLRIPQNYVVFCQIWFALLSIGRLPDVSIYE